MWEIIVATHSKQSVAASHSKQPVGSELTGQLGRLMASPFRSLRFRSPKAAQRVTS